MKNIHFMIIFLILIVGTASAEHACVADDGTAFFCGDTVTMSCTLNGSMICSLGAGLIIGADDITIDGYNATDQLYYTITGNASGNDCEPFRNRHQS